ncbi:MAG: hypothetical protein BHW00_01945 [Clostridium sp. 26_22]|nr:MAG: hypothetical protein BHW00_01945 [Clostridium sp. 26_22]
MDKEIDFSVSNEVSKKTVGHIYDLFYKVTTKYYCEAKLLEDLKDMLDCMRYNAARPKVYPRKNNKRHGLSYEIIRAYYDAFGLEYTKEDYKRSLSNKGKNHIDDEER